MDKKSFFILCAIFCVLSFSVSATAALIPSIASYFGSDYLLAGKLVWIYMLAYGLFALLWGPLTRKFAVKKILLTTLFLFSLSSFVVGSAPKLFFAFIGRLGMGVFGSCFTPLSLIIIGKEVKPESKPKYVGFLFSTSFMASLSGVFLSGLLFWRFIYLIPSFLGGALLIYSLYFLKGFDYRGKFKISYFETFKDKNVLTLFTFIILGSFFYHSIQQWLGVYLAKEYFFSQFFISAVFTVSSLAAIFAENIGGFCASRFGSRNIAFWGLLSMAGFIAFLLNFRRPEAVFFIIVFWGLGWAFNHVGFSTLLTSLPDRFMRDASSLNSSLRFFSGGLGAFYSGKVISLLGFRADFLITGLFLCLLALFLKNRLKEVKHV
ncbi:MAG: MFS transporter [Candidatus Omnitrophica bacterium]|nr:MFS transporter [Candidatus Omnitrophota bacterium]